MKNLWRNECVRRAIFQNVEGRDKGRFAAVNHYFVCNRDAGSLYPVWEGSNRFRTIFAEHIHYELLCNFEYELDVAK